MTGLSNRVCCSVLPVAALVLAHGAQAQQGACCVEGGGVIQCFLNTEAECARLGGTFQGAGTRCAPFGCVNGSTGACCAAKGQSCFTSNEEDCLLSGGTFLGEGSSCEPNPCDLPPAGACCLEDVQFCFVTDAFLCAILKGTFHEGATCDDLDCGDGGGKKEVGACCQLGPFGVSCFIASEAFCTSSGGTFQGVGTVCEPLPCDPGTGPVGACCIVGGGVVICSVLHESHCLELGGEFQGEGVACEDVECVPGDANGDGAVNVIDLLAVLAAWGPCPGGVDPCGADVTRDGVVGVTDVLLVLEHWN